MHPMLARQIEASKAADGTVDFERLSSLVSQAYADDERNQSRLRRNLELMSEEMEDLHERLAGEARNTLSRFVRESRQLMIALDAQNRIVLCSPGVVTLFGLESGRQVFMTPVTRFVPMEQMREGEAIEFLASRVDGSQIALSATLTRGALNGETFLILSLRDETERHARETAMLAAKEAAEQANAAKSSFLAMMSHELRTPLNALLGSAELMGRTAMDETQAGYVRMFNEAGRLMLALVNDVLDYSKIEAGQLELESQPTSLRALVAEAEALWGGSAEAKGLRFTCDTSGLECDSVMGDPTRLRQIVFNLLSNAVKFTASGSVTLRASCGHDGGKGGAHQLRIEVADTGVGIPGDRIETVFQAFVQADSSITRRFGGTGLGLSIARALARRMGGDLEVHSVVGAGTVFTFTATLMPADPDESRNDLSDEIAEAALSDRPIHVLAVDDNELNRRILAAMLDLWPVRTVWATNGVEALAALDSQPFDVVLMDVQMPVMDGMTATGRLRAGKGINADVPVIALTANARPEDREACLRSGMTDFVAKPIRADSLLAALARATESPSDRAAGLDAELPRRSA